VHLVGFYYKNTSINVKHHGNSKLKQLRLWQESWNLNPINLINEHVYMQ